MSNKGLQDGSVIYDFFKEEYLYWLESLSLLCDNYEGVLTVQKLEALVASCCEFICIRGNLKCLQRYTGGRDLTDIL